MPEQEGQDHVVKDNSWVGCTSLARNWRCCYLPVVCGRTFLLGAGYDMEDAMILNKSAVERGLGHATMLKTEQIDLSKESGTSSLSALFLALHADMCLRGCCRSYGCWGEVGGGFHVMLPFSRITQ